MTITTKPRCEKVFEQSIKSEYTREIYLFNMKKFMKFVVCGVYSLNFTSRSSVDPFDTILTSATSSTIQDTLLAKKKNQWGEIPIAREKYPLIQYIAFFVKTPVRAIQWIGKVKTISYNPETQKSTIYLDGNPEKTRLVPYDKKCPRHNGHGTVYTTIKRIKKAKTLCDVYPSLDKK